MMDMPENIYTYINFVTVTQLSNKCKIITFSSKKTNI